MATGRSDPIFLLPLDTQFLRSDDNSMTKMKILSIPTQSDIHVDEREQEGAEVDETHRCQEHSFSLCSSARYLSRLQR